MKNAFLLATCAIIAMSAPQVAKANDADFKLVNKTGAQVDEVYVSKHSNDDWGKDVMGRDALADGENVDITFPHGGSACHFDIKVKYHDGDTAEWNDVDLCQYEKITIVWDGKTTSAYGE